MRSLDDVFDIGDDSRGRQLAAIQGIVLPCKRNPTVTPNKLCNCPANTYALHTNKRTATGRHDVGEKGCVFQNAASDVGHRRLLERANT